MAVQKEHREFYAVDLATGWETPAGYPAGLKQKILSGALDEEKRQGTRSRLLRYEPGVFTTEVFVHDYWEEVYVLSGSLTEGGEAFGPNTYACRPPGSPHGPFQSDGGCLLFEIQYYDPA